MLTQPFSIVHRNQISEPNEPRRRARKKERKKEDGEGRWAEEQETDFRVENCHRRGARWNAGASARGGGLHQVVQLHLRSHATRVNHNTHTHTSRCEKKPVNRHKRKTQTLQRRSGDQWSTCRRDARAGRACVRARSVADRLDTIALFLLRPRLWSPWRALSQKLVTQRPACPLKYVKVARRQVGRRVTVNRLSNAKKPGGVRRLRRNA